MVSLLKDLLFNKSCALGIIIALGVFSKYIFGNDNLFSETARVLTKVFTGVQIDFNDSPSNNKNTEGCTKNEDISKLYKYYHKF